jgi:hypothetical protein
VGPLRGHTPPLTLAGDAGGRGVTMRAGSGVHLARDRDRDAAAAEGTSTLARYCTFRTSHPQAALLSHFEGPLLPSQWQPPSPPSPCLARRHWQPQAGSLSERPASRGGCPASSQPQARPAARDLTSVTVPVPAALRRSMRLPVPSRDSEPGPAGGPGPLSGIRRSLRVPPM